MSKASKRRKTQGTDRTPRREKKLSARPPRAAVPIRFRLFVGAIAAIVVAATFITFLPVLDADFVSWDDDKNILQNPSFRGLTAEHLKWIFSFENFKMGHFQPLSWFTLALDYQFGKLKPRGYHLTNLLFHCTTAAAVFFLSLRLFRITLREAVERSQASAIICAGLAALFYSVHPLRTESVAWVTERRDVLSGLFFVLTIIAYLRACTARPDGRINVLWYALSILWLLLCLLSKAWGMTMPAVLIILDVYPLRRLGRSFRDWFSPASLLVWTQKVPFVALAMFSAVQAARAQAAGYGTMKSIADHGLVARLGQAFYGLAFYIYKTIIPTDLYAIVEIPPGYTGLEWTNLLAVAAVITITITLISLRRHCPAALAVWVCYAAVVSPVLGLLQSGPQLVKDSYSYLCCIGWGILLGGVILKLLTLEFAPPSTDPLPNKSTGLQDRFKPHTTGVIAIVLLALAVVTLAVGTRIQTRHWQDSEALFTRVLAIDPASYNGNNNMGTLRRKEQRYDEAIEHYRRAIEREPHQANPHYNLGNSLKALNRYHEAIGSFLWAIECDPLLGPAHFNLANTYSNVSQLRDREKALHHFQEALRIKKNPRAPAFGQKTTTLYYCIAFELNELGRLDEARQHLIKCLRLDPNHKQALKLKEELEG